MKIAIGICVIATLIAIYDEYIDTDESKNLRFYSYGTFFIGMILMSIANIKKKN